VAAAGGTIVTALVETALEPDRAVPGRDTLLDGEAMAERLEAAHGRGGAVTGCEPVRAKYQVGRSLRVLYRVRTDDREHLVALRTFAPHRVEAVYRSARRRAVDCGDLAGVGVSQELNAVSFTFPNDRKLAQLPRLAGSGELVAYAPEKCATVRVADGFAKAYATAEGARTGRTHACLERPAAALGLTVPRILRYDDSGRILVCEPVAGQALSSLPVPRRNEALRGLGAAAARLHRLPPPPGVARFERHAPGRLAAAAAAISAVRPDLRDRCQDLVCQLEASRPRAAEVACLHGDLHLKNAIVSAAGVALVDLDQVCAGPAAADVGSLLAALRHAAATDPTASSPDSGAAFVDGYAGVAAPPDLGTLRWHIAAALLTERALRSVTRLRAAGLAGLESTLADVATLAAGGEG
jgi:aminoglycoside phosphotransferase